MRLNRLAKSVSQERLAFASGLDRTFVSAVERGVRNPSLLSAFALARALEIDLAELVKPAEEALSRLKDLDLVAEEGGMRYGEGAQHSDVGLGDSPRPSGIQRARPSPRT